MHVLLQCFIGWFRCLSAHITCFPVDVWRLFDLEILENGRCYTSGLHWCFSLSRWQAFFFRKSTANHPVRVSYPMVVQFNLVQQVPSWEASYFFSNQPFRCCFTQDPLGCFWEEHIIRGESSTWVSVLPVQSYITLGNLHGQFISRPVGTSFPWWVLCLQYDDSAMVKIFRFLYIQMSIQRCSSPMWQP